MENDRTKTNASSDASSPLPSRRKRRRGRCLSRNKSANVGAQSADSTDTEYDLESKKCRESIYWTQERMEGFGLFYEKEASTFSDFYELLNSCEGKNRYGFNYPLNGEERRLLDSLLDQTNDLLERHGVEMRTERDWALAADWPYVFTKCRDAVRNLTQNLNETFRPASGNHTRSYVALIQFYKALQDYAQEEIWRSSSLNGESYTPTEVYSELCAKFFEIFLLMLRRGELRKSEMTINGVAVSSTPDLRLTVSTSPSLSLFVIDIVKVKTSALPSCTPFDINKTLDKNVLSQHAGELLLEFHLSVFKDVEAVFGIICMQTSLIFTCLKLTTKHYQYISEIGEDVALSGKEVDDRFDLMKDDNDVEEEGEDGDEGKSCQKKETTLTSKNTDIMKHSRKSGTIFYTKPYNYLVSKERKDIMEFLFWLGINCERINVSMD